MNRLSKILETYFNGNITIAKNEFRLYRINSIEIVQCGELFGIRKTIKVLKTLGLSDKNIINSFHDYNREDIDEVKEILLNNFY